MSLFKKTILPNGIRIVSEQQNHSKSVSLGLWVLTGTRDERSDVVGISHFLEHLVFKGTKKRNPYQIAKTLESLGGDLNAYTTRESTTYHCQVLKEDWKIGLNILTDLVCNMKISKKDFDLEKKVILQEIMMSDDSPEEIIYDYFFSTVYRNHPLGRQILGEKDTISQMTMKRVFEFYNDQYQGKNLVISASGLIDHDQLVIEAQKLLKSRNEFSSIARRQAPRWVAGRTLIERDLEQVHMLIGVPAESYHSKYRFEAYVVNSLLGGGMTSKLYQAIREKQGLAYSVFSTLNTQTDSGSITVYAATDPKNVKKVLGIVKAELLKIKKKGISKREVDIFKKQVRGQLIMGSEDIDNRMTSLGVNELTYGQYKSVEAVIAEIESVTCDSVNTYLKKYFKLEKAALILVGPNLKKDEKFFKKIKFSEERKRA